MMAKSVLVTGGTGYVGSHTCVALQNAGYDVVIVDNLCNSEAAVIEKVQSITGKRPGFFCFDLRERDQLRQVFQQHSFNAVIHFAGLKAVNESVSQPLRYYRNNLEATITLLETMDEFDVRNLVFSSSANVYGVPESLPVREDFPRDATNPYGRTKLIIEDILTDLYAADSRWQIASLRYFNPVGAHESGLIGENPSGEPGNLMPYISRVVMGRLPQLLVYGGDYPTADGTGVRDFIHVMDLAEGHVSALAWLETSSGVQAFNLGTGEGHSVLELIAAYEKVCGREISYRIVARRPGDVPASFADPSLARRLLGWNAGRSLHCMCVDEWRWQTAVGNQKA